MGISDLDMIAGDFCKRERCYFSLRILTCLGLKTSDCLEVAKEAFLRLIFTKLILKTYSMVGRDYL